MPEGAKPFGGDVAVRSVRAVCGGAMALEAIARCEGGDVVAVFGRSLLLQCGDAMVSVCDPSIGNGPLNLIVDTGDWDQRLSKVSTGERIAAAKGVGASRSCGGGAVAIDLLACEVWRPAPWPVRGSPAAIRAVLDEITAHAREFAPAEGLARVAVLRDWEDVTFSPLPGAASAAAIVRAAQAGLLGLERWLQRAGSGLTSEDSATGDVDAIRHLIGLGPGLTPSGDDFLCGVLIMLAALGEDRVRDRLASEVLGGVRALTAPLSAALLEAAMRGQSSEVLHRLAAGIAAGDLSDFQVALEAATAVGHSSGWDGVAGLVAAARIYGLSAC